jgi:hypothetical protein
MSEENVEIVREQIDAFNRGDYEAALAVLDKDVEWHVPDVAALDAPMSGVVRARTGGRDRRPLARGMGSLLLSGDGRTRTRRGGIPRGRTGWSWSR